MRPESTVVLPALRPPGGPLGAPWRAIDQIPSRSARRLVFLLEEQFTLQNERPGHNDRLPLLEARDDLDEIAAVDAGGNGDAPTMRG